MSVYSVYQNTNHRIQDGGYVLTNIGQEIETALDSRLMKITIDTDRQRRVVGDGIFAPRGRVIYAAGPRVDYRALVLAHIK